jgi:signal transduction histidine kinase
MNRPWHIGVLFVLCFAIVLAAVAWLSAAVLRLQTAEARARQEATFEESVRLALWRMDSALAPLIARESARPYFVYDSFYPAERAYTRRFSEIDYGEVLVPSPLLMQTSPLILVHFQIDAHGEWSSPQVPQGTMRDLAVTRYATRAGVDAAAERLRELRDRSDPQRLAARLPLEPPPAGGFVLAPAQAAVPPAPQQQQVLQQQVQRNLQEVQARNRALQEANAVPRAVWNELPGSTNVSEGALQPLWDDGLLLLARRASIGSAEYVQGCWLDWPAIQKWLGATIVDLFPQAQFQPQTDSPADSTPRALAALPVRLLPGPSAIGPEDATWPARVFLIIVWLCVLLAATAVAFLLFGTVSLSERRQAFVSAVTHELRTPLTTFQLYTDMLAEGMIADELTRRRYLETLRTEALRLSHLVENVLAYARLEHCGPALRTEPIALPDLLQQIRGRVGERAAGAGLALVVEPFPASLASRSVLAAPSAVEQILFNLVDNACKYAADGDRKEIRIAARHVGRWALLHIRDYGPGIPPDQRRRLFHPFHKSAREAAHSASGVGLGLALSRRLARSMGGGLQLVQVADQGACFALALRLAP